MDFDGLAPVIINLTPLPSVLPLLGLTPQMEELKPIAENFYGNLILYPERYIFRWSTCFFSRIDDQTLSWWGLFFKCWG